MPTPTILAFSGSLRKHSYNSGLLRAFVEIAGGEAEVQLVDIAWLPLFNQDAEAAYPEAIAALKDRIRSASAVIIATPEHNRSIPAALKNMLDWTSRPYGETTWKGKPVAVVGATPGGVGTAVGQYHLKQILTYLDAHVLGQPEFYVGGASEKFDSEGNLTDENTREHLVKLFDVMKSLV